VFHARMAEEAGRFDFGAVVEAITTKMIRRHPHVFGGAEARSAGMAKGMWNRIKAEEKAERLEKRKAAGLHTGEVIRHLDAVPSALPPVIQSVKLQEQAARVGFDWAEPAPILDKIEEECGELREVIQSGEKDQMFEEYGDILFAMMNLGRRLGIDPENALRATNLKFRKRFAHVEDGLMYAGLELGKADMSTMEALWQKAKTQADQ
jgi:nucleoside triphosphate diphosphatase